MPAWKTQAGIMISGRNINKFRSADDTTLMADIEEELKSHLMRVNEEIEKASWKFNIQKTKIMASGPITSCQIDGEKKWKTETDFIFLGSKITVDDDCSHEIKRWLLLERKAMTNLDSILKSREITLLTNDKGPYSQIYGFSNSHVQMWELDHKEGWALKNGWFWTVVLEKTVESYLESKDIKPVNPKEIFIRRTDAEGKTPILWQHNMKTQLIGKDPDAGKDWKQEKKGVTEDEMFARHNRLNGPEFRKTPGSSEGQRTLECCSPWGGKYVDTT